MKKFYLQNKLQDKINNVEFSLMECNNSNGTLNILLNSGNSDVANIFICWKQRKCHDCPWHSIFFTSAQFEELRHFRYSKIRRENILLHFSASDTVCKRIQYQQSRLHRQHKDYYDIRDHHNFCLLFFFFSANNLDISHELASIV